MCLGIVVQLLYCVSSSVIILKTFSRNITPRAARPSYKSCSLILPFYELLAPEDECGEKQAVGRGCISDVAPLVSGASAASLGSQRAAESSDLLWL